ncbi:hypothetical protein V8C26DRAFT_358322 [Trichoderma gracile]
MSDCNRLPQTQLHQPWPSSRQPTLGMLVNRWCLAAPSASYEAQGFYSLQQFGHMRDAFCGLANKSYVCGGTIVGSDSGNGGERPDSYKHRVAHRHVAWVF